jgi:hypothetical protein
MYGMTPIRETGKPMKVGDLVQVNYYGKRYGGIGLIIAPALSLASEWWIVEWAHASKRRETIRSEHLKIISS